MWVDLVTEIRCGPSLSGSESESLSESKGLAHGVRTRETRRIPRLLFDSDTDSDPDSYPSRADQQIADLYATEAFELPKVRSIHRYSGPG